ncbi:MAG: hypothetical protein ACLQBY_02885 [Solirubrobacteraceae bacterium]
MTATAPRGGGAQPAWGVGSPAGAKVRRLPPAWTITAALGVVYLILAPQSPDLAAASYRSSLFSTAGFTLWDNSWYGGHHLLAYSVLAPALGALVGAQPLAAISMVIATALFARLIDGCFPARAARIAAAWFAFGASVSLLSSRVPFDLGLAIGLGALLLARRRRLALALALSVLTALASPVAGAFLALAFLAWALSGPARAWPAALTVAALVPIGLLALAFPEGGTQPFAASAFYPDLAGVLTVGALVGRGRSELARRAIVIGAALYALALIGSYALPTAVGGNADRLGALAAGPVAACVLAGASRGRRRLLVVLAPFLLYWQANAPATDFASTVSNPSVHASYYSPLLGELRARGVGYGARPARIEVVATADHWEARYLAPHVMIARGWERQLDAYRNGLFYEESKPLTAARYRVWLSENAVSYVALPLDATLDYSAHSEARLLTAGRPSYLREVWRSRNWRLFAVLGASPLAQAPALLTAASSDSLTLYAPRPGSYTVRVRFTPYWALASGSGCVARTANEWTEVRARRAGSFRVVIRFSLARVFSDAPRCR